MPSWEGDPFRANHKSLKTKVAGLLIVALCVSLAAPAIAGAQPVNPTSDQYDNQLTQINRVPAVRSGEPVPA